MFVHFFFSFLYFLHDGSTWSCPFFAWGLLRCHDEGGIYRLFDEGIVRLLGMMESVIPLDRWLMACLKWGWLFSFYYFFFPRFLFIFRVDTSRWCWYLGETRFLFYFLSLVWCNLKAEIFVYLFEIRNFLFEVVDEILCAFTTETSWMMF